MGKKRTIRSLIAIVLSISMILSSFAYPQGSEAKAKAAISTLSKTFTGDGFMVSYNISSQWGSAYNANVTVTNTGTSLIKNWSLKFYLDDTITNIWNASITNKEGDIYNIQNSGWNQDIAVGRSVSFGFTASVNGDITVPSSFYLPSFTTQLELVPASDYNVEFFVDSDWSAGFTGRFIISNLTNQPINDWSLEFDFDKNINSIWNGTIKNQTGGHYTITNKIYNASVVSGSAISVGFTGSTGNVTNEPNNYKLWKQSDVSTSTSNDTDGDGIDNNTELIQGTNPYHQDTDTVPPSSPIELVVTEQSSTSIAIAWKASIDNRGVTDYDVYINNTLAGTVVETNYRADNLTPGTTYQFTVIAKDAAGNMSALSAVLEATTEKGDDTKAPSAPSGLSAAIVTNNAISLTWDAATDNVGIKAYEIYCNNKLLDIVSTTNYSYTGIKEGEVYSFYIVAKDAAGNASAKSDSVTITSLDTSAPTAPKNLICTKRSSFTLALQWNASEDNVKVAGYDIYVNSTKVGSTTQETEYILTGLSPNTNYSITIKALDEVGNSSQDSETLSVATLPAAVMNLIAEYGEHGVTLSWDPVDGAERYKLKINDEIITLNKEEIYLQTSVLPMTQYLYQVCTISGNDAGEWSEEVQVFTPPAKVESLIARVISDSEIELQWPAVDQADAYDIEINGNIVATMDGTTYLHKDISTVEANNYRVRAVNGEYKGLWSDSVLKANCVVVSGGAITADTEWDKSNGYYLIQGNVTIDQEATLTVKAGTIIKFAQGVGMTVNGTLKTLGEEKYPVIMTTELDPAYGGSGINSFADHWRGISIESIGSYTAEATNILHAGYHDDEDVITGYAVLAKGMLSMNHCTVSDSAQQGIRIEAEQQVSIQNSIIEASQSDNIAVAKKTDTGVISLCNNILRSSQGCGLGIYELGDSDFTVENNQFIGNREVPIQIDLSGIRSSVAISGILQNSYAEQGLFNDIYLYGELATDITLNEKRYAFGNIIVPKGFTLRILPSTTMLGYAGYSSITVEGKLIAEANSDKKIVFSSTSDPDYGGKAIAGANDYWIGIHVKETGEFRGDNIIIRYAGLGEAPGEVGALSINDNLTISDLQSSLLAEGRVYLINSMITDSYTNGILIIPGQDVTIQNNIITDSMEENIKIGNTYYYTEPSEGEDTVHGIITIRENVLKNAAGSGLLLYNQGTCALMIEGNQILNNSKYPISVYLYGIKGSYVLSELWNNILEGNQDSNYIYIDGGVSHDLVIPAGVYNVGSIDIYYSTMSVSAGTVFLMEESITVHDGGELIIAGTQDKQVTFTGKEDPEYGGSGIVNEYRQWSGIYLFDERGAINADHMILKYARDGFEVRDGSFSLTNSKIMNCDNGIVIDFYYIENTFSKIYIKYNSFLDNSCAVFIDSPYGVKIDLSHNYWNSVFGPDYGIAKAEKPDAYFTPIIMPELPGPGENVVVYDRYGISKVELILTPYLGSELSLSSQFSKNEGVNAATGNYSKQFMDMSVNSLGDMVAFTRSYNSQDKREGVLGKGWTFGFEGSISDYEGVPGTKLVRLPNGTQEVFTINEDGSYNAGYSRSTLLKKPDGSYILKTPEKISYGFQANGALVWIENRDKNRLTITLNQENKPIALTDYSRRSYTFQYTNGLLTNISDSKGRTVEYTYENEQLVKVVGSEKNVTYYSYTSEGQLSEIRDGNKDLLESISYATCPTGLIVAQITDAYGGRQDYVYDSTGGMTTITDGDGNTTTQWYDSTYHVTKLTDSEGNTVNATYFYYDGVNKYSEIASETDKNGNTTTFERDAEGNIIKIINPDASYQLFTYDDNNNMTSEQDENGNLTYYQYDETGTYLLKEIRPINGTDLYTTGADLNKFAITSYTYYNENVYGCKGLKKSVTDPEGNTASYTYDAEGNVISTTDEAGYTTKYSYNDKGLLNETITPKGELTKYTYYSNGRLETIVLPGGETTLYRYDNLGRLIQKITPNIYATTQSEEAGYRYTYYSSGAVHTITDPLGNVTAYTYDLHGNLKSETRANGCIYSYQYDSLDRIKAEYVQEDATQEKTLLRSYTYTILEDHKSQKTVTLFMNAAQSATTTYVYDYAGRLVKQTNPDGGIIITSYNVNGTVYSETDAEEYTTYYQYDGLKRVTAQWIPYFNGKYTYYAFTYDRNGNQTSASTGEEAVSLWGKPTTLQTARSTYDKCSRILTNTDQEEATTAYEYDSNGNVTKEMADLSSSRAKVTEYDYNHLGKVATKKQQISGKVQTTSYTYDEEGNLLSITDWLGNQIINTYDLTGRLTSTTNSYGIVILRNEYDDINNKMISYDALGGKTINQYDGRGRLISTVDAAGNITAKSYDNADNIVTVTDGNKALTGYTYDTMNRLTMVTNAKEESTTYTYDKNGNLLTQKDGKGNTLTYTYNAVNKPISKADATDTTAKPSKESYTYSANGMLLTKTDRSGNITTYAYDRTGKLRSEDVGASSIDYTYDFAGNVLTMTDATGLTTCTYDELGRVLSKKVPGIGTATYEYDITTGVEAGNYKEKSTDPAGNVTWKEFDKEGRLIKVITGADEVTYTYYDNGATKSVIYPDGSSEEYTYKADDRIQSLVNKKANGTIIDRYSYTYDNAGNQLTKTETINGTLKGTTSYTYDELNRLLSVTEPGGRITEYTYDKAGNRQTEAVTVMDSKTGRGITTLNTYAYDSRNQLTDITTKVDNILTSKAVYTYDKNGNLLNVKTDSYADGQLKTSIITATYTYDLRNQMIKSVTAETAVENTYNGEGYRVGKVSTGINGKTEETQYLYEGRRVVLETDASGHQTARNVYGINLLMRSIEGETYYYMYNGHGDVVQMVDRNGNVVNNYQYDEWGNILDSNETVSNPFKYAGEVYDQEAGLYYLRARYYDSSMGRFINEDSFEGKTNNPLSLNLYTYCYNNPIIYIDPTGKTVYTIGTEVKDYNGNKLYNVFLEERLLDGTFVFFGFKPFVGLGNVISHWLIGAKEISISDKDLNKLVSKLNNIKNSPYINISTSLISDYTFLTDNFDNLKKLGKFGKTISNIGTIFSAIDLGEFIFDDDYIIESIVYWKFYNSLYSKSREGVELKYLYAYSEVEKLVANGEIEYGVDLLGFVNVNYFPKSKLKSIKDVLDLMD